jgi:hypothetical protein
MHARSLPGPAAAGPLRGVLASDMPGSATQPMQRVELEAWSDDG